eukprot:GFKZ01009935.1.p1 GENE.GFKZ01009935.1~~GFKZ01009935.1.p1  ORF type:complete len:139 (+),score=3.64 GFKZ01009935.1:181-597(+)
MPAGTLPQSQLPLPPKCLPSTAHKKETPPQQSAHRVPIARSAPRTASPQPRAPHTHRKVLYGTVTVQVLAGVGVDYEVKYLLSGLNDRPADILVHPPSTPSDSLPPPPVAFDVTNTLFIPTQSFAHSSTPPISCGKYR